MKKKKLGVFFTTAEYESLASRAQQAGTSMSDLVRTYTLLGLKAGAEYPEPVMVEEPLGITTAKHPSLLSTTPLAPPIPNDELDKKLILPAPRPPDEPYKESSTRAVLDMLTRGKGDEDAI